jgi:putative ABC transport system permease protein
MNPGLTPARLRPGDVLRVGGTGLRARPLRALLSALGIAIGIAAMVSVIGVSTSSRADLDRRLAQLGTNLLTVGPGSSLFDRPAHLTEGAVEMIHRIGAVESVSAIGRVAGAKVYRNDRISSLESGGIAVLATRTDLPGTVGTSMSRGAFLNAATAGYPAVVLGASAARWLGVGEPEPRQQVWLGGHWFTVTGILDPVPLVPELDAAALIGWPVATQLLGFDGYATTIYTRSREDAVEQVRALLAATANPEHPDEVAVSRPSDALAAKRATDRTLNALLLGLGAVALLVGGIGVANTMVISVLERRTEIGLRRALGATRGQVRVQFLTESLLLSVLGGLGGALLGAAVTAGYAATQRWPATVPLWADAAALAATLAIGAVAGLYPAIRAARLPPARALAA